MFCLSVLFWHSDLCPVTSVGLSFLVAPGPVFPHDPVYVSRSCQSPLSQSPFVFPVLSVYQFQAVFLFCLFLFCSFCFSVSLSLSFCYLSSFCSTISMFSLSFCFSVSPLSVSAVVSGRLFLCLFSFAVSSDFLSSSFCLSFSFCISRSLRSVSVPARTFVHFLSWSDSNSFMFLHRVYPGISFCLNICPGCTLSLCLCVLIDAQCLCITAVFSDVLI